MSSAGQQLVAGRIPGERIATTKVTADSATFTAETVVITVVAELVIGRTYGVWANPGFNSAVVNDEVRATLREDSISGNVIDQSCQEMSGGAVTTRKHPVLLYDEYVALASANKTFVVTGEHIVGTGPIALRASPARPSFLHVSYISG